VGGNYRGRANCNSKTRCLPRSPSKGSTSSIDTGSCIFSC
jgi:hypothetical protein